MKHRQSRIKFECDSCHKQTDWLVIDNEQPKVPEISKGWIVDYNLSGGISYDNPTDYCSMKCLHEAVDKHFEPYDIKE